MSTPANIAYLVVAIYSWLIVGRVLLGWIPARVRGRMLLLVVERILRTLTEPYLRLFRRLLPTARIASVGIDVSALAGLIVLLILMRVLARL
jgi:YggT family protein